MSTTLSAVSYGLTSQPAVVDGQVHAARHRVTLTFDVPAGYPEKSATVPVVLAAAGAAAALVGVRILVSRSSVPSPTGSVRLIGQTPPMTRTHCLALATILGPAAERTSATRPGLVAVPEVTWELLADGTLASRTPAEAAAISIMRPTVHPSRLALLLAEHGHVMAHTLRRDGLLLTPALTPGTTPETWLAVLPAGLRALARTDGSTWEPPQGKRTAESRSEAEWAVFTHFSVRTPPTATL